MVLSYNARLLVSVHSLLRRSALSTSGKHASESLVCPVHSSLLPGCSLTLRSACESVRSCLYLRRYFHRIRYRTCPPNGGTGYVQDELLIVRLYSKRYRMRIGGTAIVLVRSDRRNWHRMSSVQGLRSLRRLPYNENALHSGHI